MAEQQQHAHTRPAVAVGDRVISWYDDDPVEYGGPDEDRAGWSTLSFGLLDNGLPVRKCDPDKVAPADTPISARDGRVGVDKRPRSEMPYGEPGVWRLTLPGVTHPSWHRTKRDATTTGLRRLAILDWHAGLIQAGLVVLPHTGMTVPHTRLTLRKLRAMNTSDGEAYTAELLLDGKPVGSIENSGQGGATIWFPHNRDVFGWDAMAAFVAQCRDTDGEPMTEEFVLADLFEEARTARDIARFVKAGKVPVRTFAAITSDGSEVVDSFPNAYYGVPATWGDDPTRLAAGMWRQRPDAHAIQMWTGERWHDLPRPDAAPPGMVRISLPTTGYVVLETAQRDGAEPRRATTFIDPAGRMDDAAAVDHVSAELRALAAHAPSNVVHTWRLVHRTSDGDRVLLTPEPVRGAGNPLPD